MLLPLVYSVHGCGRILRLRLREMVEGEVVIPHPSKMGGTCIAQNSPSQLRILGRLDQVNIALQYVIVQFPPDWFGVASLVMFIIEMRLSII